MGRPTASIPSGHSTGSRRVLATVGRSQTAHPSLCVKGLGRLGLERPGAIRGWPGALVASLSRRTKNHRDCRSSDLGATSDEGRSDALTDLDERGYRFLGRGRACSFERAGGDADRLTGQQSGVDLIREALQHARVDVLGPMDEETLDLRFSHVG